MREPLAVGYYAPTESFRAIPEHVAVMRTRDHGLVALFGPTGDACSEEDARLFSAAQDLRDAALIARAAMRRRVSPAVVEFALEEALKKAGVPHG